MVLGVDLWKRLSMFPGPCCLHPGEMTSDKGVHWAGVGSLVLEMADNIFFSTWHPHYLLIYIKSSSLHSV